MTEEVRWTPAGKAALAEEYGELLRDATNAELEQRVFEHAKQRASQWAGGAAKADAEGKAAAALAAKTIAKGRLPALSVDDAARLLSLVGGDGSQHVPPLGELVIRALGAGEAMAVLARMWSHRSGSHSIAAIEDDDDHVHDTSCSYSKGTFADYLARRFRSAPAPERAEMKKGVTAIWKQTTPHARPALAWATQDPKRAKESALELIEAGESPWPYYAWDHLPYVLTDAELVLRLLGERNLSLSLIKNIGTAIWPVYEERIGGHSDARYRAELLRQFSNFYGPKTALILAEYEDAKDCTPIVREYFALYPELLEAIIDDPALKYRREDLAKLIDRPVQVRRRP